ncbi:hypothetical protein [Nocardia jinanensis]|uniref:Uncharacterized protein n=1 Tax=Nocardia jinanensis TaxID=382504 RepID=A0A917RYM5_9NOCA|nr:hypothetical protein [Nocardia jinanensis]GGL42662.1 hypothetical protein GCM10011588_66690 [Nocardia jinanensis]
MRKKLGFAAIATAIAIGSFAGAGAAAAESGLPLEPAAPAPVSGPETARGEVAGGLFSGSALVELATFSSCGATPRCM